MNKLSADDLKRVVAEVRSKGGEAGLRDIAFCLVSRFLEEPVYAYKAIFGSNPPVDFGDYSRSERIYNLGNVLDMECPMPEEGKAEEKTDADLPEEKKPDDGMSFDEIKKGMEEDLASLVALRDKTDDDGYPVLDAKDMASVVGRIADIRVKLTEKFGSGDRKDEQRVIVISKYNDICPNCGHEVAIDPTHRRLF